MAESRSLLFPPDEMSKPFNKMDSGSELAITVGGGGGTPNSLLRPAETPSGRNSYIPYIIQVCGWPIGCNHSVGNADAYPLDRGHLPLYRRPMVGVWVGEVGDSISSVSHGVDGMAAGVPEGGGESRSTGAVGVPLGGGGTGSLYAYAVTSD